MGFWIALGKIVIILWLLCVIVMLPVYYIRKRKGAENNTIKQLVLKALLASVIFVLVFCAGLIAMYFEDEFNQGGF